MDQPRAASVLVVDDDKNQRNMLCFALQNRGYRVVAVASGAEALEQARSTPFDAAVCDVMMPGVDGLATLKGLKEAQPGLEVIMATGYGTAETALRSKRMGAFNYLAKPYELPELLDVLERALRRRPETGS